jgi:hypothetical protein
MPDIYCGDVILDDDDTYLDDDTRLHKSGNDLVLQIKVGDVWVDQQIWGS